MKYLLILTTTIIVLASCSPRNQPCAAYDIDYTCEHIDETTEDKAS